VNARSPAEADRGIAVGGDKEAMTFENRRAELAHTRAAQPHQAAAHVRTTGEMQYQEPDQRLASTD
jgi:hypothetical protein